MYIPSVQEFNCCANRHDALTIDISKCDPESVLFQINSCDVYIQDPEQVLMIRDMLTVWLSRQKQPLKECSQGYGHAGHWCGADYNCWLDPRPKNERN